MKEVQDLMRSVQSLIDGYESELARLREEDRKLIRLLLSLIMDSDLVEDDPDFKDLVALMHSYFNDELPLKEYMERLDELKARIDEDDCENSGEADT